MKKQCTKCKQNKDAKDFAIKCGEKRQSQCKICHRLYSKQHYNDNLKYYKDKAKKRRRKVYAENRTLVDKYKQRAGCKYCSESNPCCLDFHHLNDKLFNISSCLNTVTTKTLRIEIAKCDVVCSNCHRKLHAGCLNSG